ncbi:WG repeat-containing protein [Paenibacillus sp. USHLN196]|uniref:WG repeat-containing protein n=1 Tax=Paenibacillus sp. USHLN196 TaxID=3081291 RepID=UPI0030199E23
MLSQQIEKNTKRYLHLVKAWQLYNPLISMGSLFGAIDKTGKIIIKPKYNELKDFHEGLAAVGKEINGDTLYGFIDKTGKEVIKPQYASVGSFNSGLALVQDKNTLKYGFIYNPLK